ncbi:MAG: DinB family protein [candidate division NC10 bacterium]
MANAIVTDLRAKSDAAWANLTRQLQGMEPYMDRSDAPGEWTTRQVLSHLLFEPGWNPVDFLKKFSTTDLPLGEIIPGQTNVTPERQKMTLRQFLDALGGQRREVFAYLEGLSEADLQGRKARIPFLKEFLGTDEIALAMYAGLLFDVHWNDHAGQLAKIRKAVGL